MAAHCEVCGKGPMTGCTISHAHNKAKRIFKPNLKRLKVVTSTGGNTRKYVCSKCVKAGKVVKAC